METSIIKLKFSAPVHFGDGNLSGSTKCISADTLFSALFIEANNNKLSRDVLLNDILISDTFPYIDDILYFPKPLISVKPKEKDDINYKEFKKLEFIPVNLIKDFIEGRVTSDKAKKIHEEMKTGISNTTTKVFLDNVYNGQDSEPYTVGSYTYYSNSGIYFIVQGSAESLKVLKKVLKSLQYSGIGGKRSSGFGKFSFSISDGKELGDLKINSLNAEKYILLSTAMAKKHELSKCLENAKFILSKRSGFVQSALYSKNFVKKKDFYSFKSGSVFMNTFEGAIFDVSQNGNHPVYRYAKAMWLGV